MINYHETMPEKLRKSSLCPEITALQYAVDGYMSKNFHSEFPAIVSHLASVKFEPLIL